MQRKIILSIGHGKSEEGGKDPGAVANNTTEYDVVRAVCISAAQQLQVRGVDVLLVSEDPVLSLTQRIKYINNHTKGEELCLEVHMNSAASEASGTEIYYLDGSKIAEEEANKFGAFLTKRLGLPFRGAKADATTRHGRLGFVRETKPLAFLIELGFITNRSDLATIVSQGGTALCYTILDYIGRAPDEKGQLVRTELEPWEMMESSVGMDLGYFSGKFPRKALTRVEGASLVRKAILAMSRAVEANTLDAFLKKITLPNEKI